MSATTGSDSERQIDRCADYLGSIYQRSVRAVPALLSEAITVARGVGDPRRLALALAFGLARGNYSVSLRRHRRHPLLFTLP
jgi:hypothetical protein